MSDALARLREGHWSKLADWLDMKYPNDPSPEVQNDLRLLHRTLPKLLRVAEAAREAGCLCYLPAPNGHTARCRELQAALADLEAP